MASEASSEKSIKSLNELLHPQFLERLHTLDVYQLGYLMGQEQMLKDAMHLKLTKNSIFSYEASHYTTYRPQYSQALFAAIHFIRLTLRRYACKVSVITLLAMTAGGREFPVCFNSRLQEIKPQ